MLGNCFCLEKPRFGGVFLLGWGPDGEGAFCRAEPMLGCSPAMTLWPILRRLQPPKFAPFDATGLSIVEQ